MIPVVAGSSPVSHPTFIDLSIERELKFRLAPRDGTRVIRELALGAPIALSTIYFDTPHRQLSRARAALRLRRVGRQWLQAFKCEHAPGSRGEWEVAAPNGTLEVARLPRTQIRNASGIDPAALNGQLRPLFETRFTRRATNVRFRDAILEIALDRGAIIAGTRREPILELELELKSGPPGSMLRYAYRLVEPLGLQLSLASKAERGYRLALGEAREPRKWRQPALANAKPHEALARLAAAALEQIAVNAEGMALDGDPEYLHQLRVGMRRLRSLFGAFRALEPKTAPIRRRLRAFNAVLGEARDWDVLARSRVPVPPAGRKARERARALVASAAFNQALVRILRWVDEAPWRTSNEPLAAFAAESLERLHRKTMKTARRMKWSEADDRHALRIRVKRLRYASDAFAECFPSAEVRDYLAALEKLQDDFGQLNDIAVARRVMAPSRRQAAREAMLIARAKRDWAAFVRRAAFWRADM